MLVGRVADGWPHRVGVFLVGNPQNVQRDLNSAVKELWGGRQMRGCVVLAARVAQLDTLQSTVKVIFQLVPTCYKAGRALRTMLEP